VSRCPATSGLVLAASPERGTPIVQIGHSHPLLGHAFRPDGRRGAICYLESNAIDVLFWDIETGRPLWRCYTLHNGSRWLTVTPEGRVFGNLEYVR
jgi:hypothetical protein